MKILNKMSGNQIQKYIEKIIHYNKGDLFQECKTDSVFENQLTQSITPTHERRKIT
jgi:hypothetical protein